MARKRLKPAPAVELKRNAGAPALNPLSMAQQSPLGMFADIEVARKAYEGNSAWVLWHADADAQAQWAQPVQPRRRNGGASP